jgi:ATP-binding cassette, subfamily B, multidrug efflux pump
LREMGTHQELLGQRGIYWKLYQLQYKDQEVQSLRTADGLLDAKLAVGTD